MTQVFGKGSHSSTMLEVCDCATSKEEARRKRMEWIKDVYKRFGPSEKAYDQPFLEGLLTKYKGREGELYYFLITKYGGTDGFVAFDNIPNTFEIEGPSEVGGSSE